VRISIDPSIIDLYPDLQVGIVGVWGATNDQTPDALTTLLRDAERTVRKRVHDPVNALPEVAVWQNAHKRFGGKPNRYAPSLQALVKRVLKGDAVPTINPLVDLYNVISLVHLLPVGGEDLDTVRGSVRLTRAAGGELFVALGQQVDDPPEPGEVIWRDDAGVLCRKFNWREADRTKLTAKTRNAILVMEALPPIDRDKLSAAVEECAALVQRYANAGTSTIILDTQTPSGEILG
jgi:DNA/RNA-binding domain of Phe-tRNA-synthetase-like protein